MSEVERSAAGDPVLRHEKLERGFASPAGPGDGPEIAAHLSRYLGEPAFVLHEELPHRVHVDLHVVPPGPEREWFTVFTTGMSDLPMSVPPGSEDLRHAELLLCLPPDWDLGALRGATPPADAERWSWPLQWLRTLAWMPHETGAGVGPGHTLAIGERPEPFHPTTRFCAWMLFPPTSLPQSAWPIPLADGRVVQLYAVHGLHPEELRLKLKRGTEALLDAFDRAGVTDVLTPQRAPAVRKKLFGLF